MNENTKIALSAIVAVLLSVSLSYVLITPREGLMGPQGEGVQGIPGEQGPQGSPGESIVGPMGPQGLQGLTGEPGESIVGPQGEKGDKGDPGDPAFDWVNADDLELVLEYGQWVDLSRYEHTISFTITQPVWFVDFTSAHEKSLSTGYTALVQIYEGSLYNEACWQWYTRNIFAQTRFYMAGDGDYVMVIRLTGAYRVDIAVRQIGSP